MRERTRKIYLCGRMIGLPNFNFPAFHTITTQLRGAWRTVTNPAEINPDGGNWNDCMRRDIAALMDCDTVATLPGWEHSKCARLEVAPLAEADTRVLWWSGTEKKFVQVFRHDRPKYEHLGWYAERIATQEAFNFQLYVTDDIDCFCGD